MKKLLLAPFAGLALSVAAAAPVTPSIGSAVGDDPVRIGPDSNGVRLARDGDARPGASVTSSSAAHCCRTWSEKILRVRLCGAPTAGQQPQPSV
ncbi:MAG: hypothetical protein MUC86_05200 [Burkholderiaceae bacterium]|nr:hypothetical protein [Burkholderiaceae bacterium]